MSPAARISLAIAVAWAGGLGSFAGPGWARFAAGLAVMLGCVWLRSHVREQDSDARLHQVARMFALALLLGLLARALGRVIIEVPAALWALPIVAVSLLLRRRAGLALLLALAATLAGAWFEAGGLQPRGLVHSGPIIGVHPRQAVAVRIDGFGPHDLVVDDYVDPPHVDPPGGLGYDPEHWAAWLELELHAIAQTHYAQGPARAREAFANAEVRVVDAVVPPAEQQAYPSRLGVEVRSGTSGEGSRVEFVCPGRTVGANRSAAPESNHACPRKYVVDGSTGLGLRSRFPGYTEVRGRDRARLATWLGWPHADARRDRRSLALESGAWLLLLLVGAWALGRKSSSALGREDDERASTLAGLAALGLAGIAVIGSPAPIDASAGGPTLLAIAMLALAPTRPDAPPERDLVMPVMPVMPVIGLLALLAASPLAGSGDVLALLDRGVEALVLGLGLDWATSRALAGGLAVVALAGGLGVCAGALFESRERRHEQALPHAQRRGEAIRLGLALALAVALALRKPTDDLALLQGAAALLLASTLHVRSGPSRLLVALALALACSLGPLLALARDGAVGPVELGSAILASLGCLALVLSR